MKRSKFNFFTFWNNLSLNVKVFSLLIGLFLILTFATIYIVFFVTNSSITSYEQKIIKNDAEQIKQTVQNDLKELKTITSLYAKQESILSFLQNDFKSYPEEITASQFALQSIDALVFSRSNGELFFSIMHQADKYQMLISPAKQEFTDFVQRYFSINTVKKDFSGIVSINGELYMVACSSLINNSHKQIGQLWAFRKYNNIQYSNIKQKVYILPYTGLATFDALAKKENCNINWTQLVQKLITNYPVTISDNNNLASAMLINNSFGSIVIVIIKKFQLKNLAPSIINSLSAFYIIIILTFFYIIYFFMSNQIIRPLKKIHSTIVNQIPAEFYTEYHSGNEIKYITKLIQKGIEYWQDTEKYLNKIAFIDTLTGLYNRAGIQVEIEKTIRTFDKVAIFFLDIDDFKLINDTLGDKRGNDILCYIAGRLTNFCEKNSYKVARVNGDEFVLVAPLTENNDKAPKIANQIFKLFTAPISINNYEFLLKISIGISISPEHGKNSEELIAFANLAVHSAKQAGKNIFKFYTTQLSDSVKEQLYIESQLHTALTTDEICPFFQPIISLKEKSIVGAEALARWQKPDGTFVSPASFIPVAERTGMITKLDILVLDQAYNWLEHWKNLGLKQIYISSNLSRRHFQRKTIVKDVTQILNAHPTISSDQIKLEMTETTYMQYGKNIQKQINQLIELGFKIFIDDFGTGYSSLSILQKIPFSTLKIDASFVWNLPDPAAIKLLTIIINLAKTFGFTPLAEGIETKEQLKIVTELGCELGQGYLFSPPVSGEAFQNLLYPENEQKICQI